MQYGENFNKFVEALPDVANYHSSNRPERIITLSNEQAYTVFGITVYFSKDDKLIFETDDLKGLAIKIIELSLICGVKTKLESGLKFLLKRLINNTSLLTLLKDFGFSVNEDGALVPTSG